MHTNKSIFKKLKIAITAGLTVSIVISSVAIVSALTATTTVSSAISPIISLFTTNGTVNVDVTPAAGSTKQTIASDTVTVSTNDSAGYTLTLADTDTNTNLVNGGNNIAASAGTQASPVTPEATNTWGYAVAGIGGFNASGYGSASSAAVSGTLKFAGVPSSASPNTIKTTSGVASSDTTTVWYAVAVDATQPYGTYTDSVTYTATTN